MDDSVTSTICLELLPIDQTKYHRTISILKLHYKIMDIGSEWLPWQGLDKFYMRGPSPESQTPWWILNNEPIKPQPSKGAHVERGVWLMPGCNQKYTQTMLVLVKFLTKEKIHNAGCFFEMCALNMYMYFCDPNCPSFYIYVQNAFTLY